MPSALLKPRFSFLRARQCAGALCVFLLAGGAGAQCLPGSPEPTAGAQSSTQTAGVALSELKTRAPERYTVKRGDTLWAVAGVFLKNPWRWPDLWGMSQQEMCAKNLVFAGQVLHLQKSGTHARLSAHQGSADQVGAHQGAPRTVRLSPRTRYESIEDSRIPTLSLQATEAFLTEPLIVDEAEFARAPRIVATQDSRVLLTRGDRAYARGQYSDKTGGQPLVKQPGGSPQTYRVFRQAVPLKDPVSGQTLGLEAQYVGKVVLLEGESVRERVDAAGKMQREMVPATIDIVLAKEEMRVGDRLLPEPPHEFPNYAPRAPERAQSGQIVSVYGNAVSFASQNQVVSINRGAAHGLEPGHVLAIARDSQLVVDKTDSAQPTLRLPGDRNGLMMVFRVFEKMSYALVLQITDGVKVGDAFTQP